MIYTVENCKLFGAVKVFINGAQIFRALLADEKKGKVCYCRYPLKLDKYKKRILTRTAYGKVTVERVA